MIQPTALNRIPVLAISMLSFFILPSAMAVWGCSAPDPVRPQALLDRLVQQNQGRGGGVFRVEDQSGQILWEGMSGDLRFRHPTPMSATATFEIASTSKAFTAAAVLLLVEDGLLNLDAPISTYLEDELTKNLLVIDDHDFGPELTLRQMLNHTAGLPDYWYDPPFVEPKTNAFLHDYVEHPHRQWTPREILRYVPKLKPINTPGIEWHYSDSGYLLAGLIIESVTEQALHEVYRERIFLPLKMKDTWLQWREPIRRDLPRSVRYEGGSQMTLKRHNSADWAGGGLVSTTNDLSLFLRALAKCTLFKNADTLDVMMEWVPTGEGGISYGLGLYHVPLGFGLGSVWGHDGYGNSFMYYWPSHEITLVGTLNQTENDWWPLVVNAAFHLKK